jgi:hypothetical protein
MDSLRSIAARKWKQTVSSPEAWELDFERKQFFSEHYFNQSGL